MTSSFIGILVSFFLAAFTTILAVLKVSDLWIIDWFWVFSPLWISVLFCSIWVINCIFAALVIKAVNYVKEADE